MAIHLTPDGYRYVAMAEGQRVSRPFFYRWLLPLACGPWGKNWRAVSIAAASGMVPVAWWYGGFGWRGLFVAAFAYGCSGVMWFNLKFPVLVDLPAMFMALLAAACWQEGLYPAAILAVLIAGCIKETSPVFAAAWAWHPLLLVGLIPVAVRHLMRDGDDVLDEENAWVIAHPFQAALKYHQDRWHHPLLWIWPWGVGLIALANPSPQLLVVLLIAYGQCFMATDTVRLYQWAWPVVAVCAAGAVPVAWLLPLAVMHVGNPWRGPGT